MQPVDGDQVLSKLAALPLRSWQYTGDATRHLGPTGKQLNDAFGLGNGGGYVPPTDVGAVALAATQALATKVAATQASVNKAAATQASAETSAARVAADTQANSDALLALRKQNQKLKKRLRRLEKKVAALGR